MDHAGRQCIARRVARPAGQLGVSEPAVREARLPYLEPLAFENVLVRRLCGAVVVAVECAVVPQDLGEPQPDPRTAWPAHLQSNPADQVLPEIEDGNSWLGAGDGLCWPLLRHANRLAALAHETLEGRVGRRQRADPVAVGEAGLIPAVHLQPGIVCLAVVEAVSRDWRRVRFPGVVTDKALPRAVRVLHVQLQNAAEVTPRIDGGLSPTQPAGPPAAAQYHADRVVSTPEVVGHVVSLILHPLGIVRPAGSEHVFADRLPVDRHPVAPQPARVGPRPPHFTFDRDLLSQAEGPDCPFLFTGLIRRRDPPRGPLPRIEQAHLPPGRLGVRRRAALPVPGTDHPA